ncbi:hypothetical protein [Sandaracinobacteroides saxicola]|uniref:Uncharacterized protein n=1 Tax=Sandaracinobacteroides saxicola TaxID=2759707 RepID=A0A7G5IJ38_9SPHN|nr:hypothetical protein [Sandaracinobacteroides saxicola]QMW23380.1 hypothetical protein H3309_02435 [Sandaracinobacteroides saxicola]
MAIVSATVEGNGWVLAVRGVWGASAFADFVLEPDAAARVAVSVTQAAGFDRVAGQAVANNARARVAMVAVKPLRRAFPNAGQLDEVNHGGGERTVRLALSNRVHGGESVSVAFAAGWRTGEGAAVVAAVNGSTRTAALPVMRWATPAYQRQTGPFRVDLLVASHYPIAADAVAAVRFQVTDGTTVLTQWVTATSVSGDVGDGLRCWGAVINPAGLNAGVVTVHATVFPWIGASRSTGAAQGTATSGFGTAAVVGLGVAWDPAGTRYPEAHVFVDPAGGSATASAGMVYASAAAAKAGSKAASISVAVQALYLANRSAAAANGLSAITRMADNGVISLAAGNHAGLGSQSVTSGLMTAECALVIQGDPSLADARAQVVLATAAGAPAIRSTRHLLRNLTLEVGTNTLAAAAQRYWHLDNVTVRGKAGQATNGVAPFLAPNAGEWNLSATRTRWWQTGSSFLGSNGRFGLVRNCEHARMAEALCLVGNSQIADASVTVVVNAWGGWGNQSVGNGDAASQADVVIWGNRAMALTGRAILWPMWGGGNAADPGRCVRGVAVNNVAERVSTLGSGEPLWSLGEDAYEIGVDLIVEGNSFAGERCNFHNDPNDTVTNLAHLGWRVANNVFDWAATKHDDFVDGTHGARPALTGAWELLYGVGFEGNVHLLRHGSAANFGFESDGLRSARNPVVGQPGNGWARFANDRCKLSGGATTGGGDYRPTAGAPMLARATRGQLAVDASGRERAASWAAGALEADVAVVLAPAGAVSATRAGGPALGWRGVLAAGSARSGGRAGAALLGWSGGVSPLPGWQAVRGDGAGLVWAGALLARAGGLATVSGEAGLAWAGVLAGEAAAQAGRGDAGALAWRGVLVALPGMMRLVSAEAGVAAVAGGPLRAAARRQRRVTGDVRGRRAEAIEI